jgi:MFS family permease
MIGFLLKNFGCGISYVVVTKFVEEIVPDHLLGPYFSVIPLFSTLGFVVAGFLTDILPSYDAPVDELVAN